MTSSMRPPMMRTSREQGMYHGQSPLRTCSTYRSQSRESRPTDGSSRSRLQSPHSGVDNRKNSATSDAFASLDYALMAVSALQKSTGMHFTLDNFSVPPFVEEMHEYVARHGRRRALPRHQLERKMEWFVRRKMLCGMRLEEEEEEEEGEGEVEKEDDTSAEEEEEEEVKDGHFGAGRNRRRRRRWFDEAVHVVTETMEAKKKKMKKPSVHAVVSTNFRDMEEWVDESCFEII